jgi:hypothetical protein
MSSSHVLDINNWDVSNTRFMQPKINDRGGKSVNVISNQTNKGIHISLPYLMTWGVADYVDEKTGESDGKYSASLSFPSEDYATPATTTALNKLKEFDNYILDAAVKHSEVWWGESMSREVVKHTFFPFLKYSRNKDTKKIDLTKPPTIRAKVPFYDGRWNVEIFNPKMQMLYPADDNTTPMDHISPRSNIACVLQCGGIWIGGKGWGLTWKMFQCVVKNNNPPVSLKGVCSVILPKDEEVEEPEVPATPRNVGSSSSTKKALPPVITAEVDDSDTEEPAPVTKESIPTKAPEPVVKEPEPVVKEPEPVVEEISAPAPVAEEPAPAVKKVVKKVVKKA